MRRNIFELLEEKWNLTEELGRLNRFFDDEYLIVYSTEKFTLRDFVDTYCFEDWKNRGRYFDVADYLDALDYDRLNIRAENDIESFLTVIEIMYNFFYTAYTMIEEDNRFEQYAEFERFKDSMDICLERYNQAAFYFKDKEQVIISEKDSAVTAVAEIAEPEIAFQIVRYNHHTLKGDIITKKKILLYLASDLEPKRSLINNINKSFSDDIFLLLNNMNLRHNNCDQHSKYYKKYVAEMQEETLEEWYDELYQMILLANLELDHLERKNKITELKTHF